MPQKWEEISAAKRAAVADSIPPEFRIPDHLVPPDSQLDISKFAKESGWFTEQELNITSSSAAAILDKIASRAWTSEEVTRAFCKAAGAAHQLVSSFNIPDL